MRTTWIEVLVVIAIVFLLVGGGFFFGAWLFHQAWSNVAVPVFHWPALTYWQSFWIVIGLWVIGRMFRASTTVNAKGK